MGGGLMQLVAMGAQDVYLTGNPQITFFKVVYRRHTNFSKECIAQTFSGSIPETGTGSVTCTLARNGDLVQEIYLKATLNADDLTQTALTDLSGTKDFEAGTVPAQGKKISFTADVKIGDTVVVQKETRYLVKTSS